MPKIRRFVPVLIFLVAAIFAIALANTHAARILEGAALESRFVYRGESSADSTLALVLWDDSSAAKLEPGPAFREAIATMVKGLAKMQARVIAVDFFFEEKKAPVSDSLLCATFLHTPNAVTAFLHNSKVEEPGNFNPSPKTVGVQEYRGFILGVDGVNLLPGLRDPRIRLGHANFLTDTVTSKVRFVPLYITSDSARAAFALAIVKVYFGMTDDQIKASDGKLALFPAGREPIRIPINKFGEYEINYPGDESVFAQRHSFHEVYDLCRQALADSARFVENEIFKNKIVLIGSIIDADKFYTPFSNLFPGVFIHATIVDNILREQFLIRTPRGAELAILFIVGALLFWLFSSYKLSIQIAGVALLLLGYSALTFVVFDQGRIITPLVSVICFILLAAAMQGVYLHVSALKRQKMIKSRIREIANSRVESRLRKQFNSLAPAPYYFLAIDAHEERENYNFIHWLKLIEPGDSVMMPFEPEIKVSPPVHRNNLNKLEHDIQKLWERYSQASEAQGPDNLGEELKKISRRIANDFGLKQAFRELSKNNAPSFPLKLAVTNLRIPWHWAMSEGTQNLLCENYSLGFTFFDPAKEQAAKLERPEPKSRLDKNAGRMAVLYYGDWQGHPHKQLNLVRGQITKLHEQLTWQDCSTLVVREKCQDFLNRLTKACTEGYNLRLIHYAGHAERNFLDVGENDYLKSNTISGAFGLSFSSRPLVFLNACSSGRLSDKRDKMDNLCTEFLACGAGACIVTNFDVYERTAGRFAQIFYEYFVARNLAAGEALRLTINDLGKPDPRHDYDPDHDITRYFYTLYGDPTLKF
ncbi:MAG: CHASE2 domain-containing protein [candidate division KSB1 bacterium]|nr:CHASE2 domain-containing protein [candidate division KSB1 bacterium]MDZ7369372.1 CHASE2 domain-containing protein [candidate division KSB1 bacterium]MDZ7403207.1 CHASE2 domain-containing protein [candidate division KSB1 bacterium]